MLWGYFFFGVFMATLFIWTTVKGGNYVSTHDGFFSRLVAILYFVFWLSVFGGVIYLIIKWFS